MADISWDERFRMAFSPEDYRRVIAGKEVIIHCHHYNARLQKTLESAQDIDGKHIIKSSAETVFAEQISAALRSDDDEDARWAVAARLYSHLGYGALDFSARDDGMITASSSHFVEGWNAHFRERSEPVCSFAEGYIQGAYFALTGEVVDVREEACMIQGHDACRFVVTPGRTEPHVPLEKGPFALAPSNERAFVHSPNIDEQTIIDALVQMPIMGNDEGLIPAFGVYLANTPADFYNLICIRFIEEMEQIGLGSSAKKLLIYDAEHCGMNTFRGIMHSVEWDGLVAPMIKAEGDALHGLIAISNGLGWGNWHVCEHLPGESLTMASLNGYEAIGFRELRSSADSPQCYMLTGVAAGIMELLYGTGTIEERFGLYASWEDDCICSEHDSCHISAELIGS